MNEASQEELRLLEEWIVLDSENRHYFEQIRDTWNAIEIKKELSKETIQTDLHNVLKRLDEGIDSYENGPINKKWIKNSWILKVAAVFILGFSLSWFVFNGQKSITLQDPVYSVIETPKGSSTIVNLPDGSKIWLNAESKLTYPQNFSATKREVYLEGEAFFNIAKNKNKKFLVNTSGLTIKVYGTSFNVKSYPEDNTVETTLVEGSISIYKNSSDGQSEREIKLEPNQQIVLYKNPKVNMPEEIEPVKIEKQTLNKPGFVLTKQIDTKKFTSWKDGQLIFKSEPLSKLSVTLERRYDVKIHFEDEEIKQVRFTGTIEDETIEQVMSAIVLASDIDYKMKERDIWISRKGNQFSENAKLLK